MEKIQKRSDDAGENGEKSKGETGLCQEHCSFTHVTGEEAPFLDPDIGGW